MSDHPTLPPIVDLNKYKTIKLHRKYLEDINVMLQIIDLAVKGLEHYKHYVAAGNVITSALQSKKLLLQYKKFSEEEIAR